MTPRVSMLLTTYNHAPYVQQALDSLEAQDLDPALFEVIATDDCSPDESAALLRAWCESTHLTTSLVVNERNVGICAVRNRALARARGELVCSLAGDDFMEPDRLRRQSEFLLAQPPDVALVYSDVRVCDPDGGPLPATPPDTTPEGWVFTPLLENCFVPAQGVMARREALLAVGGYDESLAFEDWDMWLRLADRYPFAYLPMVSGTWRRVPTSLWHSSDGTARSFTTTIALQSKWLERDEASARTAARIIRTCAVELSRFDRQAALEALRRVHDVPADDSIPWPVVERLLEHDTGARIVGAVWRLHMRRRRVGL